MPIATSPIIDTLRDAQILLKETSDSAQIDAEVLLAYTLDCDRTYLRTWPEKLLTTEQQTLFHHLISRRCTGEPIAYMTGEREFWGMTLQVSPDTLIPRPETEHLVELALKKIPQDADWQIADLGTGCGAIALAIARERPHCKIIASDTSTAALAVAQKNANHLNIVNVTFVEGSWLEPFSTQRESQKDKQQFEMIVSNPPYIHPDDDHLSKGDLRFEPAQALRSAPDGLTDIKSIADAARDYLTSPGWLILEHGYDQGSAVKKSLETLGYSHVATVKDLAKNERISIARWDR